MFKTIQKSAVQQLRRTRLQPQCPSSYAVRTYAANRDTTPFDWKDPLGAHKNLFTDEELDIAETAESYCQEKLLPRILGMPHTTPPSILNAKLDPCAFLQYQA